MAVIRINTPDGSRIVPNWAKCYCVVRHTPTYVHPYPFALPDGREMWFCPNTYHQATTLQALYHKLGAPPEGQEIVQNYSTFVRRLIKMSWQQTVNQTTAMEQAAQTAEGAARELREMTERVKRVILDVPE